MSQESSLKTRAATTGPNALFLQPALISDPQKKSKKPVNNAPVNPADGVGKKLASAHKQFKELNRSGTPTQTRAKAFTKALKLGGGSVEEKSNFHIVLEEKGAHAEAARIKKLQAET